MEIIGVVSEVTTKKGRTSSGPFEIRYQKADFIMPNRRAKALETRTPRDGEYPPGLYILAAEGFSINQWDQLGVECHRVVYGSGGKVYLACMVTGFSRNWYLVSTGHMGGGCGVPHVRC